MHQPLPHQNHFGLDAALPGDLPRPLVFTNGVFDLLHAGHVFCLQEARKLGRSLVVGLNTDRSARRLNKGPGRPINSQEHRCHVIAALACVDAVLLFDEDDPLTLLKHLQPDFYVKGSDYRIDTLSEARIVAAWGGQTVIIPHHEGLSSSRLMERIVAAQGALTATR